MSFTESNTVEQMILDAATPLSLWRDLTTVKVGLPGDSLGDEFKLATRTHVPWNQIPRQPGDVMVATLLQR